MRGWRRLLDRLTGRADQNLERELRAHLDLEAEELRESGIPHDEAHYAALRAFGNTTLAMEDTRAMWGWTWLEHFGQDVRYAIRILRRNPTFALTALLTLALGIGANSAIFSLINSVLFRPLPFPDDGRLVLFWNDNRTIGFSGPGAVCDPDFLEWQTRNTSFSEIGIFRPQTHNLTSPGDPERLLGAAVTPEVFRLLGAAPVIGPLFHERDGRTEGEPEILLSHRLWSSRFHSDPSVVGKLVVVDTRPHTIAGVMPAWFDFPNGAGR
jgi:hypothetical protein